MDNEMILKTFLIELWEKSSWITKVLIIWAFGPPLMMYVAMDYKDEFRAGIIAQTREERLDWAKPLIEQRNEQLSTINEKISNQSVDIRDLRIYMMGLNRASIHSPAATEEK